MMVTKTERVWVVLPVVIIIGSLWIKTSFATLIEFARVVTLITPLTEGDPILQLWFHEQLLFLSLGLRSLIALLIGGLFLATYVLVKRWHRPKVSSVTKESGDS